MTVIDRVNQLVESSLRALTGVTYFGNVFKALLPLVRALMDVVAQLDDDGKNKKALVLEAIGRWFDALAPAIVVPWPWYLAWIDTLRPVLRPWIREQLLVVVGDLIEWIYETHKPSFS